MKRDHAKLRSSQVASRTHKCFAEEEEAEFDNAALYVFYDLDVCQYEKPKGQSKSKIRM